MNPFPGFATFGTAGFTADASSFSFKGAYVKGLANRHFAGIPKQLLFTKKNFTTRAL